MIRYYTRMLWTLLNLLNELDKQFFIKSMSIFDKSVQVILIQEKGTATHQSNRPKLFQSITPICFRDQRIHFNLFLSILLMEKGDASFFHIFLFSASRIEACLGLGLNICEGAGLGLGLRFAFKDPGTIF